MVLPVQLQTKVETPMHRDGRNFEKLRGTRGHNQPPATRADFTCIKRYCFECAQPGSGGERGESRARTGREYCKNRARRTRALGLAGETLLVTLCQQQQGRHPIVPFTQAGSSLSCSGIAAVVRAASWAKPK